MKDSWLLVGQVLSPFGIKGGIKIHVLTDFPERFTERPLYVGKQRVPQTVVSWRRHGGSAVLFLRDVECVEAAEKLRGADLFTNVTDVQHLPEGEFYVHQIVGLRAVTEVGNEIGVVSDVLPTGSNDVYVLKRPDRREILIPAIKDVVRAIDLTEGRIVIRPTDGLGIDVP